MSDQNKRKYICLVTPNPALDLGGRVNSLIPNEKSYVYDQTKYPGGNAINASRILHRLKIPVLCTGFLGGGTGQEIKELLDRETVNSEFVDIAHATRINITVSNTKDHNQTRLTFPGPEISKSEKEKLFSMIKKQKNISHLVVGGSLPPGFSPADINRLIEIARANRVETIVDCPGEILRKILPSRPILIKPNLLEFQELTQTRVKTISSIKQESQKLLKFVKMICISSVEGGTLLITNETCHFGKIAKVKIQSTVGAGDSMVGSIVAQLYKNNQDPADLLRWGLAASAATLSQKGTTLGSARDVQRLYRKTKVPTSI